MNYLKNCKALIAMIVCASLTVMSCSDEIDEIIPDEVSSDKQIEEKAPIIVYQEKATTFFYNKKEYTASDWENYQKSNLTKDEAKFMIALGDKILVYNSHEETQAIIERLSSTLEVKKNSFSNKKSDDLRVNYDENIYNDLYKYVTTGSDFTIKSSTFAQAILNFYRGTNRNSIQGYFTNYLYQNVGTTWSAPFVYKSNLPSGYRLNTNSVAWFYIKAPRSPGSSYFPAVDSRMQVKMYEDLNNGGNDYRKTLTQTGSSHINNDLGSNPWWSGQQDWDDRAQSYGFCIGCTSGDW